MSEQPTDGHRFTPEEAADLIERATAITHRDEDGLSYDQLVGIAGEVGIEEAIVAEALRQAQAEEAERRMHADNPAPWRSAADRCLEILCLKPPRPVETSRH